MPQRLLLDRVFHPDHLVRIVFDRDADGSRRAVIDLANGGQCVLYAADEFWEQVLGATAHRLKDGDFLHGFGGGATDIGGGQGVRDLNTEELIGAVAAAAVPVPVALGHATDDLVLNRVADVSFPTPPALGAWLRQVPEEKRDRARQAEAEAIERAGGLMEQLGRLQKVQAALARWQAVAAVLAVLLLVAVAWLLFAK